MEIRQESRIKQNEDRRLNAFWRINKGFPTQFGGDPGTRRHAGVLEDNQQQGDEPWEES